MNLDYSAEIKHFCFNQQDINLQPIGITLPAKTAKKKPQRIFQADWQNKSLATQQGLSLLINVLNKHVKPCKHQNEFSSKVCQSG